ncbi:hypothetical protein [Kordiimonas pumila]|uniref:Uncharacterized protein n=1 Tax=Kordiimonas pumila TaxID=2161677 RepID=A0ABV7D8I5_9PROT|nr:hypothetical protein [Kordiimonas pumila]
MAKLTDIYDELRDIVMGPAPKTWAQNARLTYSKLLNGLKGYSGDTLRKTTQSFNEAIPYIERAGYDITEIEVGIGLSPRITPHLRLREIIDDEERMAILHEVRGKRLVHTILVSLFRATSARKNLNFQQFYFSDLEMELSLLPTVILKFKPNTSGITTERPDTLIQDAIKLGIISAPEDEEAQPEQAPAKTPSKAKKPL